MKLVSYRTAAGPAYGRLEADTIVPTTQPGRPTLRDVLAAGELDAHADVAAGAPVPLADVRLLPVVPDPGKILCAGVNYRAHRDEVGPDEFAHPTIFTRFADSQLGAGEPVIRPQRVDKFDYEGELALIIGLSGYEIPVERACDHVAGYACYNDFSARDWQRHSSQWTPGKNFVGTGAFGPCLVTADEIHDVDRLELETRVNGEVRQSAVVADLLFGIPQLISYISSFTPLAAGDVIVTGTPGGAGMFRDPPVFLAVGDEVEVEITHLGVLSNTVRAEEPPPRS